MRSLNRFCLGVTALIALSTTTAACGSDSLDFGVEEEVPLQRVEGNALGEVLGDVLPFPVHVDLQAEIDARNVGPIDSVTLSSVALDVITDTTRSCPGGTWSFLDKIELFVEAPNLPQVRIAAATGPGSVKQLILRPTSPEVNLVPYLEAGATLTATGTGRAPTSDVCYDGVARFTVHPL